jgi:hypothetical protein
MIFTVKIAKNLTHYMDALVVSFKRNFMKLQIKKEICINLLFKYYIKKDNEKIVYFLNIILVILNYITIIKNKSTSY